MLGFVDYDGGAATGADGYSDQDWSALMKVWPEVEQVLGRPPLDYARWARDHVADFRWRPLDRVAEWAHDRGAAGRGLPDQG